MKKERGERKGKTGIKEVKKRIGWLRTKWSVVAKKRVEWWVVKRREEW